MKTSIGALTLRQLSRMTLLSLIVLASARPTFANGQPVQSSDSVTLIRDVDGDGVRDVAQYSPDSHRDPYGPGEVVVIAGERTPRRGEELPREIARFRVETELELRALAARHPADLNDDQRIDYRDVQLLGRRLGHTLRTRGGPGDLDRNGVVDAADMTSLILTVAPRRGAAWIRWSSNWPAGFHPDNGDRGIHDKKRDCGWVNNEFFCTIDGGPGNPGDFELPGEGGGPGSNPPDPPDDCGITFTPDPLTHLPNASEAMALPGDREWIYAEVEKDCKSPPSPVYYKVHDPEIALILENSTPVEWIEGGALETIEIVGLMEGTTRLEAYADELDGEFLGSIDIRVGGTITVDYWNAPTFTPTVYDAKPPAPSQIPGDIAPPSRGPIPPEVYLAANALPDDACELRILVRDADGQPKPGKAVRVVPRDNLVTTSVRNIIFFTDQRGRTGATLFADPFLTDGHGSNEPSLEENVAILVGRAAEEYDEQQPTTLDTLRADQLFTHHRFTGNTLYFGGAIVHDGLEQFVTGLALDLPLINKVHLAIVRNCLEDRVFSPQGWIDFSKIQLALWDPGTDTEILVGGHNEIFPIYCTPDELAFPDFVNSFVLTPLSDMWTPPLVKKYAYDFGLAPYDDEEQENPPGLVTAGAIAAEFALCFIPGYDLVDAVKYNLLAALDETNSGFNLTMSAISAVGLLADAGYLAGGVPGIAANAIAGVLKITVKYLGEPAARLFLNLLEDSDPVASIRFMIDYLSGFPKPPGFSWTNPSAVNTYAVNMATGTINQWQRVLHSPIGLQQTHLAAAINILGRRATRTYDDEAAEGAAFIAKIERNHALEAVFDEMDELGISEGWIEAGLGDIAIIARRELGDLEDEALKAVCVVNEIAGVGNDWCRRLANGTRLVGDQRIHTLYTNTARLKGISGAKKFVRRLSTSANNENALAGGIYEATTSRQLLDDLSPELGRPTLLSADGIDGAWTIDTLTTHAALQIKHTVAEEFTPSMLHGQGLTGADYLDQMIKDAAHFVLPAVLITNKPLRHDLDTLIKARNMNWMLIPD